MTESFIENLPNHKIISRTQSRVEFKLEDNTISSKDKSSTSQKDENKTVDNPTTENSSNNSNNTDQNTNAPGTTSQNQTTPAPLQTPTKIPNTGPQDE